MYGALPPGYARFEPRRGTTVVCLAQLVDTIREVLEEGTLYAYGVRHPRARVLSGRGAVYAVPLPDNVTSAVIRHSQHGGVLARLTGDRFLPPTRAPHELAISLRLRSAGVLTPEILAYATYAAGPVWRRADVMTREIPRGRDLAALCLGDVAATERESAFRATDRLLARLASAGAHHADLNLKNVLIASDGGTTEAWVLDVDRVRMRRPGDARVRAANLSRLRRSAAKWRRDYGACVELADIGAA